MENNIVKVEYAGFWVRFAAEILDGLVLFIPIALFTIFFGKYLGSYVRLPLTWAYSIYMLNTRQATFGKIALGLKVSSSKGDKLEVGKIILREIIGKFLSVITLGIGFIMVAFTEKKQGLHDIIADTVVVYDPTVEKKKWLEVTAIVLFFLTIIVLVVSDIIRYF